MVVPFLLMDTESSSKPKARKRKAALNVSFSVKKERNTIYQKVITLPIAVLSWISAEWVLRSEFLSIELLVSYSIEENTRNSDFMIIFKLVFRIYP